MIPPEFREDILAVSAEGTFMITNFDKAIAGYTLTEWARIESELSKARNSDINLRNFLRFFIGGAHLVQLDKQGRILVPPSLRAYAALDKDVVLVGVLNRFEIWSKERHSAQIASQDFDDMAASLANSGVEVSF